MYLNCVNFTLLHAKIYIEYCGIVDNNHIYPCLFLHSHMFILTFTYSLNDIDSEYNNKVSFLNVHPMKR